MKQGSEIRDQGLESTEQLLRKALEPVGERETERDLWPAMRQRMEEHSPAPPWFDWALACGVAVFALAFPASIPVFFYYL